MFELTELSCLRVVNALDYYIELLYLHLKKEYIILEHATAKVYLRQ